MQFIGATVMLTQVDGRMMIIDSSSGEVLAEHDLTQPGTASVVDEHYYGARPAPNRGSRLRTTVEQQFCALGDSAEQFLVGAAAIGNTRLSSELEVLLALGAAHGPEALVGALTGAVAFRRFRAADVRSILAAGAGTPHPRPADDALILDLPTAPTRSLDAYAVRPPSSGQQVPS